MKNAKTLSAMREAGIECNKLTETMASFTDELVNKKGLESQAHYQIACSIAVKQLKHSCSIASTDTLFYFIINLLRLALR